MSTISDLKTRPRSHQMFLNKKKNEFTQNFMQIAAAKVMKQSKKKALDIETPGVSSGDYKCL